MNMIMRILPTLPRFPSNEKPKFSVDTDHLRCAPVIRVRLVIGGVEVVSLWSRELVKGVG